MKLIKIVIYVMGVLTVLWIFSTQFELKNKSPDHPRIINPTNPIQVPKISVSKK